MTGITAHIKLHKCCSPKNVNTNLKVGYLKCQEERKLEGLHIPAFDRGIFSWGILTFKGSLLSGALMLKQLFARNQLSPDF